MKFNNDAIHRLMMVHSVKTFGGQMGGIKSINPLMILSISTDAIKVIGTAKIN
jgi:hypothetical protein